MKISRHMMTKAVNAKIITDEQSQHLIEFLKNQPEQTPEFNLSNVLYYFGGLIAIGAMTVFMTLGWDLYDGGAIMLLSVSYAVLGIALAHLFYNKGYIIPAGICATFTICLTPLAIYGLQRMMGWWVEGISYHDYYRYIKWNWIYMELGTLFVGVLLAWFYRYPFMVMPIALTLWYLSMDLTSLINNDYNYALGAQVSVCFGLVTLLIGLWVDVRSRHSGDYAFWLYLFGVLAFWSGFFVQESINEFTKMSINFLMILIGVTLNRRVFVIFGALGCFYYLGYLAFQVFSLSYLFPIALTLLGIGIIYLGILWQKNETIITAKMRSILPLSLKEFFHSRDN